MYSLFKMNAYQFIQNYLFVKIQIIFGKTMKQKNLKILVPKVVNNRIYTNNINSLSRTYRDALILVHCLQLQIENKI